MGARGPQKTPTAILKMNGSWLADRRENEPAPDPSKPARPPWLTPGARRVWNRVVPQLYAMGVIGKIDRDILAVYCTTYSKWRQAEDFLAGQARTVYPVKDKNGQVVDFRQYPQVNLAMKLGADVLRLGREFGLTSSARASLAIEKPANPDENRGKKRFFSAG